MIDGGSTDGSRQVIERYSDHLAFWCSEPDLGQYDAINKGFKNTSGEIMAWLNSSDLYLPWTLSTVREIFDKYPEVDWITSLPKTCIREDGVFESIVEVAGFTAARLCGGGHGGPKSGEYVQQETCFWRRDLWEKIGGEISNKYRFAGDFWLWSAFFRHSRCTGIDVPLAAFRFHGDQRSAASKYVEEIAGLIGELKNEKPENFVRGYQNIVRYWIPGPDGICGQSRWKLDKHADDHYLEVFRWWMERSRDLKWWGSKLSYLPISMAKFFMRGCRRMTPEEISGKR